MRSKKQGAELELSVMGSISRTLRELPPESRERVVNWVSSQHWAEQPDVKNEPGSGEKSASALS